MTNGVSNGVSNGSPTRPDPTRPELKRGTVGEGGTADRADARPPAPHPCQNEPPGFTIAMAPPPRTDSGRSDPVVFTMPEMPSAAGTQREAGA